MDNQSQVDETIRANLRWRLQSEFDVTTLLMPVKTVAAILGLAPATLYAYIRKGDFFLPYRLINKTPLIAVDDFVDWYCDPNHLLLPGSKLNEPVVNLDSPSMESMPPRKLSRAEAEKEAADIQIEALGRRNGRRFDSGNTWR